MSEIVRETGFERHYVARWHSRVQISDKRRSGRPSKTSKNLVSSVKKLMNLRKRKSLRKVAGIIAGRGIATVSHETVRKAAHSAGLNAYRRRSKPRLTEKQRIARVEFARTHAKYNWRRVFFSDESTIVTHGKPNRQIDRIWATSADQVPPIEMQKYSSYVKFWGGIGYYGKSKLVVCEKPFNSKEYIRVLKKGLKHVDAQYGGAWELQQDGDKAHTSVETRRWMSKRRPAINVLEGWPSASPEPSPIENVWPVLKDNIAARNPRSRKQLIKFAHEEWNKLDLGFLRKLIDSVPRRLLELRRANGGPISY